MADRIEVQRTISAPAGDIFAVLCDPQGHVAIDSSGMLQDADGASVAAAGDSFVVHMDRESLNDFPDFGKYDVTVTIREFEQDQLIAWTVLGQIRPQIGHVYGYRLEPDEQNEGTLVTSFYDWSQIDEKWREAGIFPVISEACAASVAGHLGSHGPARLPEGLTRHCARQLKVDECTPVNLVLTHGPIPPCSTRRTDHHHQKGAPRRAGPTQRRGPGSRASR